MYVIIFLFLVLLAGTQTCTIPAPGPGWVCQDGGWLPPGHPLIRSAHARTSNAARLAEHAESDSLWRLDAGMAARSDRTWAERIDH